MHVRRCARLAQPLRMLHLGGACLFAMLGDMGTCRQYFLQQSSKQPPCTITAICTARR